MGDGGLMKFEHVVHILSCQCVILRVFTHGFFDADRCQIPFSSSKIIGLPFSSLISPGFPWFSDELQAHQCCLEPSQVPTAAGGEHEATVDGRNLVQCDQVGRENGGHDGRHRVWMNDVVTSLSIVIRMMVYTWGIIWNVCMVGTVFRAVNFYFSQIQWLCQAVQAVLPSFKRGSPPGNPCSCTSMAGSLSSFASNFVGGAQACMGVVLEWVCAR